MSSACKPVPRRIGLRRVDNVRERAYEVGMLNQYA